MGDCGLSCVLMVLPYRDRTCILDNLSSFLQQEGFGESTWTIDLCYILYRFNLDFLYTTITMGVDPGYVKENFYDKVLAKDSDRVNLRFSEAKERGIRIQNRRVTSEEIYSHLSETGPVIVLTNANQLHCRKCSPGVSSISCYPSCFTSSSSYQGHYVVWWGVNTSSSSTVTPQSETRFVRCREQRWRRRGRLTEPTKMLFLFFRHLLNNDLATFTFHLACCNFKI